MFVSQIFDEASEILATTDKNKVFRKLTQAVQTLMESGHYFHTTQEVDVCTGWDGQTITLPRGIEVPLGVNIDGSPTYFRGRLFQYHVNKGGMYNPVDWAWDDRGFVATVMDIRQPSQLVAVSEHSADAGGQIRVIGTDSQNRPLRSQMKDGTSVDGILVSIHSQSDFPLGSIEPDGITIQTREIKIDPLTRFLSINPHQLKSGQSVVLSVGSGVIPNFIYAGTTYYVGVDDSNTIQLYKSQIDASSATNPIFLQSILGSSSINITDSREVGLNTVVAFNSIPPVTVDSPNELTFSVGGASATATISGGIITAVNLISSGTGYLTPPAIQFLGGGGAGASVTAVLTGDSVTGFTGLIGGSGYTSVPTVVISAADGALPTPLAFNTTYFGQPIDSYNIAVYPTLLDAQNRTNQILCSGRSGAFNTDIRKNIAAQTLFAFAIPHYFSTGDQVQAFTAGGTLPTPLIAGQNYFANVIDTFTISVHTTLQDAVSSSYGILINPIILTDDGTGVNSIVKLLSATSTTGGVSQITASGLNIDAPSGNGAAFNANVVGSVIGVTIGAGGTKYTSTPNVTFSSPPDAPVGSGQTTYPATGYAVMAPDAAGSTTFQVASIVITSAGLGYTSAPSVIIGAAPTGGTNATATCTIQTSFLSSFTRTSGGFGYTQPPQVKITGGGGTGATANATINSIVNKIIATNLTQTGGVATCIITTGHGYSNNQTVQISGADALSSGYNQTIAITLPPLNRSIPALQLVGTIGTTTASCVLTSHGWQTGQLVTISGVTNATMYNVTNASITVVDNNNFTYQTLSSITATTASGTMVATVLDPFKFNYSVPVATPSAASGANITSYAGNVTTVTVVTQGTGYTSKPVVTITPSTGVFVEFSSTGTLPSPLVAGTAYRAEAPLNKITGNFTVVNADFSPVTLTSASTGNFYVVLSRPFGVSFNSNWAGDFSGILTGQPMYLASDYLLPTGVNNTTKYYARKVDNSTVQLFNSLANATASPSITGLINITTIGSGQSYFGIRMPSYVLAYNDLIRLSNVEFLTEGMTVQFSSTGNIPYPLSAGVDYIISISGNNVSVKDMSGNPISFVNAGIPTLPIGQMSINIVRNFSPILSTRILCNSSIFEIGEQVTVRPNLNDNLPNPLVQSTMAMPQYYYARPIDSNSLELYDTRSHALAVQSITGRIEYLTSGDSENSTFFSDSILPPILVKSILHIEKPETLGYVSLYALDYGRSNDMALVGQYHPTETNPKYRRIRIGKQCAWARIIYRVSHPTITSVYDYIPLENERAIIAAVHACDLEDKDFMEQAQKYWSISINYLRNQHESMEGHAMSPPQINNITYGDDTDPVMF